MRRQLICTKITPQPDYASSHYFFHPSFLKSTPSSSAWSSVNGSSKYLPSSGYSCSASPLAKAKLIDFRHFYNSTADKTLSPSGFCQWLTPVFAEYFSDLVETALDEVAVPDKAGSLRRVRRFGFLVRFRWFYAFL